MSRPAPCEPPKISTNGFAELNPKAVLACSGGMLCKSSARTGLPTTVTEPLTFLNRIAAAEKANANARAPLAEIVLVRPGTASDS